MKRKDEKNENSLTCFKASTIGIPRPNQIWRPIIIRPILNFRNKQSILFKVNFTAIVFNSINNRHYQWLLEPFEHPLTRGQLIDTVLIFSLLIWF